MPESLPEGIKLQPVSYSIAMSNTLFFYPHSVYNPIVLNIISHKDNTLIFDGYVNLTQEDLPVERFISVKIDGQKVLKHIEIYEKRSGMDTTEHGCTTTEIVTLKYRMLA